MAGRDIPKICLGALPARRESMLPSARAATKDGLHLPGSEHAVADTYRNTCNTLQSDAHTLRRTTQILPDIANFPSLALGKRQGCCPPFRDWKESIVWHRLSVVARLGSKAYPHLDNGPDLWLVRSQNNRGMGSRQFKRLFIRTTQHGLGPYS